MIRLGVTGGTGSGKSTVCSYLKEKGAEIIDADIVAREIVTKGKPALCEIEKAFGDEVILSDGNLDRKKLGRIVFASSEMLNILNGITHKYIIEEIENKVKVAKSELVVIDAALLFETELSKMCDKTLAVIAGEEKRLGRIISRDSLEEETAKNRIASQKANSFYQENSDYILVNDGTLYELKLKIDEILKELM